MAASGQAPWGPAVCGWLLPSALASPRVTPDRTLGLLNLSRPHMHRINSRLSRPLRRLIHINSIHFCCALQSIARFKRSAFSTSREGSVEMSTNFMGSTVFVHPPGDD